MPVEAAASAPAAISSDIHSQLTSGVLEHKWRVSLKTILFLLTSNTEATENKVQFLNLAYRVKVFQCHSNNSLQLLELKEKTTTTKQYTLFKSFLCDIL